MGVLVVMKLITLSVQDRLRTLGVYLLFNEKNFFSSPFGKGQEEKTNNNNNNSVSPSPVESPVAMLPKMQDLWCRATRESIKMYALCFGYSTCMTVEMPYLPVATNYGEPRWHWHKGVAIRNSTLGLKIHFKSCHNVEYRCLFALVVAISQVHHQGSRLCSVEPRFEARRRRTTTELDGHAEPAGRCHPAGNH